jgi:glutaredoxin
LSIIIDVVTIDTLTCAIDLNSLYILKLPITQFYRMLRKIQLLQLATAISIASSSLMSVRANPSPPVDGVIATPQTAPNSTPKTTPQPAIENPPKTIPSAAPNDAAKPTPDIQSTGTGKIEVTTVSSKAEIALAKYLTAKGIKFYGAYSCEHCQQQKALFGAKAAAQLTYVECDANGENSQRQLCKDIKIKYFPTWIIDGKYFNGTKDLKEIATLAGYKGSMKFKHLKKNLKKVLPAATKPQ